MDFLQEKLSSEYGEASSISEGFVRRLVSFRINPLKAGAEEVLGAFSGHEVERVPWYAEAFVLHAPQERVEESAVYREGKIYLQSLSSMLPPLLLAPREGENILDMAAAPGGKTCELYALSDGKALITACERDKIRFERLRFNLARQGATRINAVLTDALKLDDALKFDKVLLDAPCSGSGTIVAGKPYRLTEEYLGKCVRAQTALLKKGLRLLKRGGTLVYSTCSILKEENEEVLRAVLPAAGGELLPLPALDVPRLPSAKNTLTVRPTSRYEGFFAALIRKI